MYAKRFGTGRPLTIFGASPSQQSKKHMYPSILQYVPGIQEFPEELVRAATNLKDVDYECKECGYNFNDPRDASYSSNLQECEVSEDELWSEIEECTMQHEAPKKNFTAKRSEFLATAISHSQTYCRSLSEKIVHSLPREVRDMIYVYMCDRMPRVSISPVKGNQKAPWRGPASVQEAEAAGWPYIHRIETPFPHLFSQKYLHKTFLYELAASLYQTATFHIWDADDISDFLNQDLLQAGCVPKDHIRKLSLVVFTDQYGSRCRSRRQIREKVAQLAHLFDIRNRNDFRLDLHLCIRHRKLRPNVARFHQLLLPHLWRLLDAGFAMRFPRVKVHYNMHRRQDNWRGNQLQTSDSRDPEDWVVNAEELDAWGESKYVRDAFKKSALHRGDIDDQDHRYGDPNDPNYDEYDYDDEEEEEAEEEPELPEGFVDEDVTSDDQGGYMSW